MIPRPLHPIVAEAAPAPAVPTTRRRARVRTTQLPMAPWRPTELAAARERAVQDLHALRDWPVPR